MPFSDGKTRAQSVELAYLGTSKLDPGAEASQNNIYRIQAWNVENTGRLQMKVFVKVTATVAAIVSFVAPAFAEDAIPSKNDVFKKWGQADGWTLYVNETRNDCVAERIDNNGNVLTMGVTSDRELGYIGIFTRADLGLKSGKDTIKVSIDDRMYEGPSRTVTHLANGYTGGYLLGNRPVFIEDVMKQYEMVVHPGEENSFTISLDGTLKAVEAARECVAELGS